MHFFQLLLAAALFFPSYSACPVLFVKLASLRTFCSLFIGYPPRQPWESSMVMTPLSSAYSPEFLPAPTGVPQFGASESSSIHQWALPFPVTSGAGNRLCSHPLPITLISVFFNLNPTLSCSSANVYHLFVQNKIQCLQVSSEVDLLTLNLRCLLY